MVLYSRPLERIHTISLFCSSPRLVIFQGFYLYPRHTQTASCPSSPPWWYATCRRCISTEHVVWHRPPHCNNSVWKWCAPPHVARAVPPELVSLINNSVHGFHRWLLVDSYSNMLRLWLRAIRSALHHVTFWAAIARPYIVWQSTNDGYHNVVVSYSIATLHTFSEAQDGNSAAPHAWCPPATHVPSVLFYDCFLPQPCFLLTWSTHQVLPTARHICLGARACQFRLYVEAPPVILALGARPARDLAVLLQQLRSRLGTMTHYFIADAVDGVPTRITFVRLLPARSLMLVAVAVRVARNGQCPHSPTSYSPSWSKCETDLITTWGLFRQYNVRSSSLMMSDVVSFLHCPRPCDFLGYEC